MNKITIIGSGWLGLPLAKQLQENSYDVLASFRNTTTRFNLHQENINSIKIDLTTTGKVPDEIFHRDVLCILISPSKNDKYVEVLKNFSNNPQLKYLKQIIFISSSSVYEDSSSPKDESSPTKEDNIIVQAEKLFENFPNVCILRFAGLMGDNRYMAKYYKDVVPNAQTIVNHIHKEDAIGIIEKIIDENVHGIYNICSPIHPTRKDVIEEQCRILNQKEPIFEHGDSKKGVILSDKINKEIAYMYRFPNPVRFIQ